MNREHVLFHLQEAEEELSGTIAALRKDPEYDIGDFLVAMQHLYHHLNTAWNGRDATPEQVAACTEEDFNKCDRFPMDLPPMSAD
jgi:hypothetical protein